MREGVRIVRTVDTSSDNGDTTRIDEVDKMKIRLRSTKIDEEREDTKDDSYTNKEDRARLYEEILRLAQDENTLPLTRKEAEDYVQNLGPLRPNTFFPEDKVIAARSIKRTWQIARVNKSKVCDGLGLWLLPNTELEVGDFIGLYTGWVYEEHSQRSVWDEEDKDNSYSLGIIAKTDGKDQLGLVHGHDRFFDRQHMLFPVAFVNEWIWTEKSRNRLPKGLVEGNMLRFTKGGIVLANKKISADIEEIELTIGLGKEGIPFGGWTMYVRTLMNRMTQIIRKVWVETPQGNMGDTIVLKVTRKLDKLEEEIERLKYTELAKWRESREGLGVLLAGVEHQREHAYSNAGLIYIDEFSWEDNLRRIVMHEEVSRRCSFRRADHPGIPESRTTGTMKFWETQKRKEEANRTREQKVGSRRSTRKQSGNLLKIDTDWESQVNDDGSRMLVWKGPNALMMDNDYLNEIVRGVRVEGLNDGQKDNDRVGIEEEVDMSIKTTIRENGEIDGLDSSSVNNIDDMGSCQTTENEVRCERHEYDNGEYIEDNGRREGTQEKGMKLCPEHQTEVIERPIEEVKEGGTDGQIKNDEKKAGSEEHTGERQIPKLCYKRCTELSSVEDIGVIQERIERLDERGQLTEDIGRLCEAYGDNLSLPDLNTMRVATWNANGLKTLRKLQLAVQLMKTASLDILFIQDTRIEPGEWQKTMIREAKELLGPGGTVFIATVQTRMEGAKGPNVGGQVILKSPRIRGVCQFWTDDSMLGLVCTVDCKLGKCDIRIVSVYVPPGGIIGDGGGMETTESGTDMNITQEFQYTGRLINRVQQFTDKYRGGMGAQEYILQTAKRKLDAHLKLTGTTAICLGDFNASGTRQSKQAVNGNIENWTRSCDMNNSVTSIWPGIQCPVTFFRGTEGVSAIDHILYSNDTGIFPKGYRVLDGALWQTLSDHRPLVVDFKVAGMLERYVSRRTRKRRQSRRLDICRDNRSNREEGKTRQDIENYQTFFLKLAGDKAEGEDRLTKIMKLTREALRSVRHRRRKQTLWSPEMVSLTANHIAILEIGRYLVGSKGRRRWETDTEVRQGISIIVENWRKQVGKLRRKRANEEDKQWEDISGRGPEYWLRYNTREEVMKQITQEKERLQAMLHKRERREWYDALGERSQKRKQDRMMGTHLRELRAVLEEDADQFTMDYLVMDGEYVVDEWRIHDSVTAHFKQWFEPLTQDWGFHSGKNDYSMMWNHKEYFIQSHQGSDIPSHLLEIIWNAMRRVKEVPEMDRQCFEEQIKIVPTMEEFKEAIRAAPTHSAGGPTEVTYNAMAAWPDEVCRDVYDILTEMWTDKRIPQEWKWRWLVPIPKVRENVRLDDLRPLMLTDVVRKIWVGIIVNKIQKHWVRYDLISNSQHGTLEHHGTESALLQFRNIVEEARESCTDVYLSSWDVKRAFDRVPKHIIIFSWMRLGVPQEIAEYLVEMDTDGSTIVRTPLGQKVWNSKGISGFTMADGGKSAKAFIAGTGTGQGNIDSPLTWTAFMDILLRALERTEGEAFHIRTNSAEGEGLEKVSDIAYVDDLISVMSRLQGLQRKAEIVCAFCLVFGLEVADTKMRVYQVQWGGEENGVTGEKKNHIDVYKNGWISQQVEVKSYADATPLKYLGVLFDLNNSDRSSLELTRDKVGKYLTRLERHSTRNDTKLDAIIYCIYPKILYAARFASWPLKVYQNIDTIFSSTFRRILGLRRTFPEELLYAPKKFKGVGLPRFSDEAQTQKMALLNRGVIGDRLTRESTMGLILRGMRQQNIKPMYAQKAMLGSSFMSDQPLFIRSLAEWLSIAQLQVCKGGMIIEGDGNEMLVDYAKRRGRDIDMETRKTMEAHGISRISDIVRYGPEHKVGTQRHMRENVPRDEWGKLAGRTVQTWEKKKERTGSIIRYVDPVFEIQYNDGAREEISARDCLDALIAEEEQLEWRWITMPPALQCIKEFLGTPPQISQITLARDQCWVTENEFYPMSEGWIWEVLGTRGEKVCVRTWLGKERHVRGEVKVGDQVRLESFSHGAASEVWVPVHTLFYDAQGIPLKRQRVILGPDINTKGVRRQVIHMFSQPTGTMYEGTLDLKLFRTIHDYAHQTDGCNFTTDGSLRYETNPIYNALVPQPCTIGRQLGLLPQATGALIAREDGRYAAQGSAAVFRITDGDEIRCRNSYDIELLMLTLGCMVRREYEIESYHREQSYIRSDSRAAVTKGIKMDMTGVRQEGYKRHGILLRRIFHSRYGKDQMIEHVHGHPERRFQKGDRWQNLVGKEAGIYLADRAAKFNITQEELDTITTETQTPILTMRAKEVLIAISAIDLWCIMDSLGTPILECPRELIERERFRKYLQHRTQIGGKGYWTQYVDSAPAMVFPNHRLMTRQVKDTKLVFNWYMRGEHKQRGSAEECCPLCKQTMAGDTERHVYTDCEYVPLDNCRREMWEELRAIMKTIPNEDTRHRAVASSLLKLFEESEDRHLIWKGIITPAQVQVMAEALQWNTNDERAKEKESREITKTIAKMMQRTGVMVQEIRKFMAATGFLMPAPTARLAALTAKQSQDKALRRQQRIDQVQGWQSNNKESTRRDKWKEKRSKKTLLIQVSDTSSWKRPQSEEQRHEQISKAGGRQEDIRDFFGTGKHGTREVRGTGEIDNTESQKDDESHILQSQSDNARLSHSGEPEQNTETSIKINTYVVEIGKSNKEKQRESQRDTLERKTRDSNKTQRVKRNSNQRDNHDRNNNRRIVRLDTLFMSKQKIDKEKETQMEDSQHHWNNIVRDEEQTREDDREIHRQSQFRGRSKKVRWWDVH